MVTLHVAGVVGSGWGVSVYLKFVTVVELIWEENKKEDGNVLVY